MPFISYSNMSNHNEWNNKLFKADIGETTKKKEPF